MAVGKAEILDSIANMTVLELSQLIKEMEEKFGVSAAAVPAETFLRFWNGADSTIPIRTAEKRPLSASNRSTIESTAPTS